MTTDKQFAVVELMGHRKFGAEITEVERFGAKFLQARILGPDVVQLVHPQAIYAVTACTEEQARRVNTEWVLRQAAPSLELPAVASSVADVDYEDRIYELERGIEYAISWLRRLNGDRLERVFAGVQRTTMLLDALVKGDPMPSCPTCGTMSCPGCVPEGPAPDAPADEVAF